MEQVNRKLSGSCECADNSLLEGEPFLFPPTPTPGRKHVIKDQDVELQALNGGAYNSEWI